jgi:8-oxo-dGTP diphosphatase
MDFDTDVSYDLNELFKPADWGDVTAVFERFSPGTKLDAFEKQISNVCVAARTKDGDWVLVRTPNGWELPGGTREPNEELRETIRREVLEESGAAVSSCIPIGLWKCISKLAAPYRPHIPHPIFYRLAVRAEVDASFGPTLPEVGQETILESCAMSLSDARNTLTKSNKKDLADLLSLAACFRE